MRKSIDKTPRTTAGFTMLEAILSVAILAIVAGLIFVAVNQYVRGLYQREMDETAKEIYIAAQTHLMLSDEFGTFAGRTQKGKPDIISPKDSTVSINGGEEYFFVVGSKTKDDESEDVAGSKGEDPNDPNNRSSVLNVMLPQGSLDETVRSSGSYIIRYRYAQTGSAVLDVFYANPNDDRFGYEFSTKDLDKLFSSNAYKDETGAAARANYGDGGAIIGYYGGNVATGSASALSAPKLVVSNAEELTATIANYGSFKDKNKDIATLELHIKGKTSRAECRLTSSDGEIDAKTGRLMFVLDSVTKSDRHFANWQSVNGKTFIPGEDIEVQAFAISKDSLRMTKSSKRTTNSLFAASKDTSVHGVIDQVLSLNSLEDGSQQSQSTGTQAASPQNRYVRIANMRHLLNLDKDVSGYNAECAEKLGGDAVYEQVADLSWPEFREKAAALGNTQAESVQVYNIIGQSYGAPGSYRPVNPDAGLNLVYEGSAHSVSGVSVPTDSRAGEAGLFGLLANAHVSDLELLNFDLVAEYDVGGLAGKALNSTIENVLVRNDVADGDDAAFGLHSVGRSVGGLVGALEDASTVTGCGAAVYVSTGGDYAGGLLGYVSGTTVVENSYAAGHTAQGRYLDTNAGAGRVNVVSASSAGGLIGAPWFTSLTVRNCYSTCSVRAGVNAGGLLGWVGTGSVENCYATGLVLSSSDAANLGGFVGSAGSASYSNSRYLDAVNYARNVAASGAGDLAGVSAFDDSADDYNRFATNSARAFPYDGTLASTYPYPTVGELGGQGVADSGSTALTKHIEAHFGDWPMAETLVVNVRG